VRLEWLTIAYLVTASVVVYLTLGQSQAMKAAWVEDILSLLPPIAFLVAARYRERPASERFPWGMHRAPSIAYLAAAIALLLFGGYVLFDSLMKLARLEHPPIGTVVVFGEQVWQGWLMLGALAYTGLPPVLLGRAKMKLAAGLHDKVLYADAEMNRADWLTAGAAAAGVIGIGFGLWFADALAGALIALDIVRDGARNVHRATYDLMDARPARYDASEPHPLNREVREALLALDWVRDVHVRLREAGHVLMGEALVVPVGDERLTERVREAGRRVRELDWRLRDVVVSPVPSLDDPGGPLEAGAAERAVAAGVRG